MERYLTEFNSDHIKTLETETIIIGSGIAGLSTAVQLVNLGIKPLIISKKTADISNSFLAQGGIAAALSKNDDPESHFLDTIQAGRGLCNHRNVRILVEEGLERVIDLLKIGVPFDKDENGKILLTKEGGHSHRRVLHVKDKTGSAIGSVLFNLLKERVRFLINYYLEEIITKDGRYLGIVVSNKTEKILIKSKSLILATGGYSSIYLRNTSAYRVSGDAIGVAFRAGCTLKDLEFIQFHPTALFIEGNPAYLITEALRGEGALLVDDKHERFIDEMKPRDEVARAIFKKYAEGRKVFLDISPLKEKGIDIENRFPTVYSLLERFEMQNKNLIPVSPAAHYSIGGISATANGKTDVEGLFAVGEVSCTGIHGANRLASNSLLECITFGYKTAYSVYIYNMYSKIHKFSIKSIKNSRKTLSKMERSMFLKKIKEIMWNNVGLERNEERLKNSLIEMENLEYQLLDYQNSRYLLDIIYLAKGIILSAKNRKESRGTHYRSDYPDEKESYKGHTKIYNDFKITMEVN